MRLTFPAIAFLSEGRHYQIEDDIRITGTIVLIEVSKRGGDVDVAPHALQDPHGTTFVVAAGTPPRQLAVYPFEVASLRPVQAFAEFTPPLVLNRHGPHLLVLPNDSPRCPRKRYTSTTG